MLFMFAHFKHGNKASLLSDCETLCLLFKSHRCPGLKELSPQEISFLLYYLTLIIPPPPFSGEAQDERKLMESQE